MATDAAGADALTPRANIRSGSPRGKSIEALHDYVYGSAHRQALRRRAEWFLRPTAASNALWWVPEGDRPTCAEAHRRLELLRTEGPTAQAFTLTRPYPPPEQAPHR